MGIDIAFSIVLYFSIAVFAGLFSFCTQESKTVSTEILCRMLLFFVLFLPAIFRYDIGADYSAYESAFNKKNIYFSEVGFSFICNLLIQYGVESWWLFFVIAFLTYFPISFLIDKEYIFVFVVSYTLFMSYLKSYDAIRQACALPYLVLSLICIIKRKYIKVLFYTFIAFSMHSSSLFFAFLLFISSFIKSKRKYQFILIVFLLLSLSGWLKNIAMAIIEKYIPIYAHYLDSKYANNAELGTGFGILLSVIIPVYMVFCKSYKYKKSYFLIMDISYVILRFSTVQFDILGRVADIAFCGVLLSYNELRFIRTKYKKIIYYFFFAIGGLLFYKGITSQIGPGTSEISLYKSIFARY